MYMIQPHPSPINSWPTSLTMQSGHKDNIYVKHKTLFNFNIKYQLDDFSDRSS